MNGLYASYNDPYQHQRDSFHDRDSDVVSEPGYFRNTESRNRHLASRGEKRSNQNQRRERSVSPSGARRRTSHQQQASYSNEKVVSSLLRHVTDRSSRDWKCKSRNCPNICIETLLRVQCAATGRD